MGDAQRVIPTAAMKLKTSTYIHTCVFMNIHVSTCIRAVFQGESATTVMGGRVAYTRSLIRGVVVDEKQRPK